MLINMFNINQQGIQGMNSTYTDILSSQQSNYSSQLFSNQNSDINSNNTFNKLLSQSTYTNVLNQNKETNVLNQNKDILKNDIKDSNNTQKSSIISQKSAKQESDKIISKKEQEKLTKNSKNSVKDIEAKKDLKDELAKLNQNKISNNEEDTDTKTKSEKEANIKEYHKLFSKTTQTENNQVSTQNKNFDQQEEQLKSKLKKSNKESELAVSTVNEHAGDIMKTAQNMQTENTMDALEETAINEVEEGMKSTKIQSKKNVQNVANKELEDSGSNNITSNKLNAEKNDVFSKNIHNVLNKADLKTKDFEKEKNSNNDSKIEKMSLENRVDSNSNNTNTEIDNKTLQFTNKLESQFGRSSQQIQTHLKQEGNHNLVQQAKLVLNGQQNGRGEIKIALHPKEFGDVKMTFNIDDNKIVGRITVGSEVAKDAMQKNMDNLAKQFQHEGYEVEGFFVSVDSNPTENYKEDENKKKFDNKNILNITEFTNHLLRQEYIGIESDTVNFIA